MENEWGRKASKAITRFFFPVPFSILEPPYFKTYSNSKSLIFGVCVYQSLQCSWCHGTLYTLFVTRVTSRPEPVLSHLYHSLLFESSSRFLLSYMLFYNRIIVILRIIEKIRISERELTLHGLGAQGRLGECFLQFLWIFIY